MIAVLIIYIAGLMFGWMLMGAVDWNRDEKKTYNRIYIWPWDVVVILLSPIKEKLAKPASVIRRYLSVVNRAIQGIFLKIGRDFRESVIEEDN